MKEYKDNLQQSSENDIKVSENVQRLIGEESTNKPDTNIPHPNEKLKCSTCKEFKAKEDFYVDRRHKRGYQFRCKTCNKHKSLKDHNENRDIILAKWRDNKKSLSKEQKKEIADKSKIWYRKDLQQRLLDRAKDRSRRNNIFINITKEDIVIPEVCPLLGIPFEYGSRYDKWRTYSIDRIDNNKGYVKGNIQVITYLANTMKSCATKKQLLTFSKNILNLFKDDDIV